MNRYSLRKRPRRANRPRAGRRSPLAAWACPDCCSDAVSVVEGQPGRVGEWPLVLRCGECGLFRQAFMHRPIAERFGSTSASAWRRSSTTLDDSPARAPTVPFSA